MDVVVAANQRAEDGAPSSCRPCARYTEQAKKDKSFAFAERCAPAGASFFPLSFYYPANELNRPFVEGNTQTRAHTIGPVILSGLPLSVFLYLAISIPPHPRTL